MMPLHPGPNVFRDDDRGLADPVASSLTSVPPCELPQARKSSSPGGAESTVTRNRFDHVFLQPSQSLSSSPDLIPQVGSTRLAQINGAELGQARVPVRSIFLRKKMDARVRPAHDEIA